VLLADCASIYCTYPINAIPVENLNYKKIPPEESGGKQLKTTIAALIK
jgi:hypothetical protein